MRFQTSIVDFLREEVSNDYIPAFGSTMETKAEGAVRMAFQNVNGIRLDSETESEEVDAMETFGIDVLGLAETNINWSLNMRLRLAALLRMKHCGSRYITSNMQTTKEGYQPMGVQP